MDLSVIIPAFNAEKTIKKTLNSLFEQTLKPKEIIIVNDGSTDSTQKIIEGISATNNSVKLFNKKNSGISASRNFGAEKASGEIIVFLDSDVTVEKQWLEKLIIPLNNKNVFCSCGKYSIELNDSFSSDFFSFIIGSSSFQGYNIAFRKKDFLESKGFNKKMKYCEDPEFFFKTFVSGKKLEKTKAESFHRSYSLNERIKANFNYSFFDAVLFKKNLFFLVNPFNLINLPENVKLIFGFYWALFFSVILAVISFFCTKNFFSFVFLFIPSLIGCIKIISVKTHVKHKNNFLFVLIYSFFLLFIFSFVKGIGFINGLIQNKH